MVCEALSDGVRDVAQTRDVPELRQAVLHQLKLGQPWEVLLSDAGRRRQRRTSGDRTDSGDPMPSRALLA
jgi:hypothetical protein